MLDIDGARADMSDVMREFKARGVHKKTPTHKCGEGLEPTTEVARADIIKGGAAILDHRYMFVAADIDMASGMQCAIRRRPLEP